LTATSPLPGLPAPHPSKRVTIQMQIKSRSVIQTTRLM
jgi:hypothetical protein